MPREIYTKKELKLELMDLLDDLTADYEVLKKTFEDAVKEVLDQYKRFSKS